MSTAAPPSLGARVGLALLLLWALFFLAGAAGELLDIPFLRALADYQALYLR